MFAFALAVYFLLFAFLAWRNFSRAMLIAVATLPSYLVRFSLGALPMTVLEGMILILCAVWVLRHFHAISAAVPSRPLLSAAGFFFAAATLAVFAAPDVRGAAGAWRAYFFEPILFFAVLAHALRTREVSTAQIIRALSISAILLSVFAFFQKFTGFWIPYPWAQESVRRVTSVFEYPNALGIFLAPLIPLFAGQESGTQSSSRQYRRDFGRAGGDRASGLRKLLVSGYWLVVIALALSAIIFAHSTGALVGVTAGFVFLWGARLIKQREKTGGFNFTFYLLPFTFLLVVALFVFKNPVLRDELLMRDWSGRVRRTIWGEAWQMLRDQPVFGAGLAGYQTAIVPYHRAKYIEIFLYPHNIILNFWSEMGLFGIAGFFWLLVFFFRATWRSFSGKDHERAKIAIVAAAGMVTLLTHGLVDVPYFKNDLAVLFWIIYALGVF